MFDELTTTLATLLVCGVVLIGVGTLLVVFRPSEHEQGSGTVEATPSSGVYRVIGVPASIICILAGVFLLYLAADLAAKTGGRRPEPEESRNSWWARTLVTTLAAQPETAPRTDDESNRTGWAYLGPQDDQSRWVFEWLAPVSETLAELETQLEAARRSHAALQRAAQMETPGFFPPAVVRAVLADSERRLIRLQDQLNRAATMRARQPVPIHSEPFTDFTGTIVGAVRGDDVPEVLYEVNDGDCVRVLDRTVVGFGTAWIKLEKQSACPD